jgi:hypothetical protein
MSNNGREESEQRGWILLMYFIYLCENRTMKPFKIILRRGEEGWGKIMEGLNLIKVYFKHIWKCHNETPHILIIYANKNVEANQHRRHSMFVERHKSLMWNSNNNISMFEYNI